MIRNSVNQIRDSLTTQLPAIKFAPLNAPFQRRRETFAAIIHTYLIGSCLFTFMIMCVIPGIQILAFIYLVYIYFDESGEQGGRRKDWFRSLAIWKWLADYFNTQLIVETKLDSSKNYIFGYHPHGMIGTGVFINFGTNATGINEKLPGLDIHPLTLTTNTKIPFLREIIAALNFGSVSKKSIRHILNKGPGSSCLIVVGGAQEALSAKPELCDLVLKNRMGFVKMALETGASLVPVFCFGENDLYEQLDISPDSKLGKIQTMFKRTIGVTVPFYFGRSIFNYNFGLLPKRHLLDVVVGSPISVEKDINPPKKK